MTTTPPDSPADFEAAMDALEALVARMETGDLPLEESLRDYQRGMELIRGCQKSLDEAQRRIESLADGASVAEPSASDRNDSTEVPDFSDSDDVPF